MRKDVCVHDAFTLARVVPGQSPDGQYVSHIIETDRVSVRLQVGLCWLCLYRLARAHLSAAVWGGGWGGQTHVTM